MLALVAFDELRDYAATVSRFFHICLEQIDVVTGVFWICGDVFGV